MTRTRVPETDAEFNTFTITATLRLGAASEGNGIYFMKVKTDKGSITQKLIIQK